MPIEYMDHVAIFIFLGAGKLMACQGGVVQSVCPG